MWVEYFKVKFFEGNFWKGEIFNRLKKAGAEWGKFFVPANQNGSQTKTGQYNCISSNVYKNLNGDSKGWEPF